MSIDSVTAWLLWAFAGAKPRPQYISFCNSITISIKNDSIKNDGVTFS